jgi:hypothetical protein
LVNFTYGEYTKNFDRHLIVTATYAGNNAKFNGDVGRIDDGFGNIQFIDRKNNIIDRNEAIQPEPLTGTGGRKHPHHPRGGR